MKVFISWSGERSRVMAEALKNWIPKVIQAIQPWMSSEDISSGARWSTEIFKELEETKFGIICITPENQHNPWILFESGALSKSIVQTFVVPYLFNIEPTQISGPLVQFQAAKSNKEGTFQLLYSLNKSLQEKSLEETQLKEVFDVWWYKLEEKLSEIPEVIGLQLAERSEKEILNEILENTREQLRKEEIRLNSIFHKEDKMGDVMKTFQKEFQKISGQNKKAFSDLLIHANENAIDIHLDENILSLDNLSPTFEKLLELIDDQKETTNKLLDKNSPKETEIE